MKNFDKCFSNMAASGLYQDITIPVKTQPIGIEKSFSAHCIHLAIPILLKIVLLGYKELEIWEENVW